MIHTVKGLGKQISRYSMYANYLDAVLCCREFLASDDPAQRAVLLMDMSMDILVCILPELTPVGVMWVMIGEDAVSKMIVNNRY